MLTFLRYASLLVTALAMTPDGPEPTSDFKQVVRLYGAGREPLGTSDLIFTRGRAYQFVVEAAHEVSIWDPSNNRVELLDLKRRIHTELRFDQLDRVEARLRDALEATIRKREQEGDRAARIEAQMSRDLLDPNFRVSEGAEPGHLTLVNPTVEVNAVGVPESAPNRLARIVAVQEALAKLATLRSPESLPPFPRLAVFRALATDRRLRPTEISMLYRLAGPPARYRWTYDLVDGLTERERKAIDLVDDLRLRSRSVRYELYERE